MTRNAEDPQHEARRDAEEETVLAAVESALVAMRRSQSRRALARSARRATWAGQPGADQNASQEAVPDAAFQLLDTLAAAEERGERLTVTEAGSAMGVDQPRASRLAAQALAAGLLARQADQADGRRSLLALTGPGRAALARIAAVRRGAIDAATEHWTAEDRRALAVLLTRFVRDFAAVTAPPPPAGGSPERH